MNYANTMKTRLPHLLALFTSVSVLLSTSTGLRAQVIPPPPGYPVVDPTTGLPIAPPKPEPIRFSDATEKKRVEANFEGLPLTEVVIWLEKTFPEVNFIVPQSLSGENPIVVLRLRAAGLRDILEAINIGTDNRVGFEVRSPTLVAFQPRPAPVSAGFAPYPGQAQPGRSTEGPPTYQVMNLREVLRTKHEAKIRETLDTIREITSRTLDIMAVDSPGPRPRQPIKSFEYHEGSGVLVIIGQPDAIKVAMDVTRNIRLQDSGGGGGKNGAVESAERQPAPKPSTGDAK